MAGDMFPTNDKANRLFKDLRLFYHHLEMIDEDAKPVVREWMEIVEMAEEFKPKLAQILQSAQNAEGSEFISEVRKDYGSIEEFEQEFEGKGKNAFEDLNNLMAVKKELKDLKDDLKSLKEDIRQQK